MNQHHELVDTFGTWPTPLHLNHAEEEIGHDGHRCKLWKLPCDGTRGKNKTVFSTVPTALGKLSAFAPSFPQFPQLRLLVLY
jgi:hypothetical protein